MYEAAFDHIVEAGIQKHELELHVGILGKELLEAGSQIQFVNVYNVLESLRLY